MEAPSIVVWQAGLIEIVESEQLASNCLVRTGREVVGATVVELRGGPRVVAYNRRLGALPVQDSMGDTRTLR